MDWDEPRSKTGKSFELGQNLDVLSIAELEGRIAALEAEIERVRAEIARKRAHEAAASSLFKPKSS